MGGVLSSARTRQPSWDGRSGDEVCAISISSVLMNHGEHYATTPDYDERCEPTDSTACRRRLVGQYVRASRVSSVSQGTAT